MKSVFILILLFLTQISNAVVHKVPSGQSIQATIDKAQTGDSVEVAPGEYFESIYIDKPGIRLLGQRLGGKWPVLDGRKTKFDGIIASGSDLIIEGFHIKNYRGNGVSTQGADQVILRNLVVQNTGIYGIYPTNGTNILVENTVTSGIADAGIYVSLSRHVDLRHNEAFENVAGIEVENSHHVLIENNYAHHNSAGIMVFTLPGLPDKASSDAIIRGNLIESNNHKNFAHSAAVAGSVPRGTGILVLAGKGVHIEGNTLRNNLTAGIIFSDLEYISDSTAFDPEVNPRYEGNRILDNLFFLNGTSPEGKVRLLLAALHFRLQGADIVAHGKGKDNCLLKGLGAETIGTKEFGVCKREGNERVLTKLKPHPTVKKGSSKTASVGESIYRSVCSSCHASGIVLIGPSVQEIQRKYRQDLRGLVEYAYQPMKLRSKFPEMPPQRHLGKERLMEVAKFLLEM